MYIPKIVYSFIIDVRINMVFISNGSESSKKYIINVNAVVKPNNCVYNDAMKFNIYMYI